MTGFGSAVGRALVAVACGGAALTGVLAACAGGGAVEEHGGPAVRRSAASEILAVTSGAVADDSGALDLFVTGDTLGFLGPCGCEGAQFGGINRRGTYLRAVGSEGDLRIDLGNAAAGTGGLRRLRLTATLGALDELEYDVFVPGPDDASLADVIAARDGGRTRIVSVNLMGPDGAARFDEWYVHELADGRRVAVVGVTGGTESVAAGWEVREAAPAVRRAVDRVRGSVDAVIVAAAMPPEEARVLAAGFPDVALVLSAGPPLDRMVAAAGHESDPRHEGFLADTPHLAMAGEFAAYVRRVVLDDDLRPGATWRAWLGEDVPDDPEIAAYHRGFRKQVSALDPDFVPNILAGLSGRGYAGSLACAECHREEYGIWKPTLHARAMEILVEKESARDPDCVPCHLVDVPEPFTKDASAADRLGVGCEACHGGRAAHIAAARADTLEQQPPPPYSAREVCTGCHRPPEVKHFDFDELWPRIAHGEDAEER